MQITDSGLVNLILAIFRYTAQDLRYGKEETKKNALLFLESQWFEDLCDLFPMDKKKIVKMIKENPVSWRDKYE